MRNWLKNWKASVCVLYNMKFQTWVSILTLLSHHLNRVFKPLLHKDKRFYKQTSLVKIALGYPLQHYWASLVAQLVKNPPAMWETWIRSLGWEDPLEKRKATHSSILEILGDSGESHGLYSPWGHKESDTTERLSLFTFTATKIKTAPVLAWPATTLNIFSWLMK